MAFQYKFKGKWVEICMCLYTMAQCNARKQCFVEWKNYLSLGIVYFDVLKEKRPKYHYIKKLQYSRVSIAISKFGNFNHIGG
jgi:hypothetical protein